MRIEHGYRPSNRWLSRPLDERWRRWVTACLGGAAVVGVSMAAFVGPRQSVMRMRYEIAQLSEQADRLDREQRRLLLEREALTSPQALTRELTQLGLEVPPRERVAYFGDDGRLLLFPAKAAPATARQAGGGATPPPVAPAKGRR